MPQITSRLHRLMTRNRSRSAASRREASESCHCKRLCLLLTPSMRMTRFPSFLQPAASLMSRIAFNARWWKGAYIPPLYHDPLYHSTPPVPAAPTLTSSCSRPTRRHSAILVYLRLGAGHHERAKLILKTRPKIHTKHCVLGKDSLNPLRFAK